MPNDFLQIKPLLIAALETGLNAYLTLDDRVEEYLAPMAGKVLAVHVTPFNETLYLCPGHDRMQLLEHYEGEADATLSGSLFALGFMGLSATPMHALFEGEVKMEGDTQLAHKLQRLFEKLDIDFEAKLARYTGDGFARRLSGFLRGGRDWSRHAASNFRLNLEEFLQEETRELPAKAEAELLFQQIDVCRSDVDRLNARVERLLTRLNPSSDAL
ncbi:MAG: SCP2 sterol-binding domain-containing protein [Methylomonas sp.]|nr:SCP2 sterol-binding domain-containing protein [Methylomonas sp.]